MKLYFLAIPIFIGIFFGIFISYNEEIPTDSNALTKENLLDGSTILGDPNAKITMVEFGDYQCTFCHKFHKDTMSQIHKKYIDTGNVNFVYKDFPLNGKDSILAAEASYCAQKQNAFWIYHDMLYDNWGGENTGWITHDILLVFARNSGLNLDEFQSCMNDSEFRQKVLKNEQFAKKININATPSFLIFNDNEVYRIIGAQPLEKFEQVFVEFGLS